jgi:hypothetical protein
MMVKVSAGIPLILAGLVILPPITALVREKWNFELTSGLKWVLVIILFIVYMVNLASIGDSSADTAAENPRVAEQEAAPPVVQRPTSYKCTTGETVSDKSKCPRVFDFNQAVQAGDFTWKFTDSRTAAFIGSNEYFRKEANGEYIIVDVEVTNTGNKAQILSDSYVKLVDGQGREYSADSTASMYLGNQQSLFFEQINPGVSKRGALVFDVPKGLDVAKVRISNNLLESSVYYVNLVT